jgi:itaconate CoA-transferase
VRARTGHGSALKVSLFDSAAELMAVPYLQARYGGRAPGRVGLKHPTIAPYGGFACADGRDIVISIQNEREWADFCRTVLQEPGLQGDARCATNAARVEHREWLDGKVAAVFAAHTSAAMIDRLTDAQTAYGSVNSLNDLIEHPQLRTRRMPVGPRSVDVPAIPWASEWDSESYRAAPAVDEHGAAIWAEFAGEVAAPRTASAE